MRLERAAGVLLHPTCLPGPHGCGDLGEAAYHFVDWLVSAGQRYWQVLPIGEVGPGNSPYMSPSSFAGNVLLIDLRRLATEGWLNDEELQAPAALQDGRVRFDATRAFRLDRLRRASERFFAQSRGARREPFDAFCQEQRHWLDDYALFTSLAQAGQGRPWSEWDAPLARRTPGALERAAREHRHQIGFWKFCQWKFRRQWNDLRRYAHRHGVRLIGDLPIFPALQSAEVWAEPALFELDPHGRPTVVAGVPPDYFSATGQRWGNPLYRWPEHEARGFRWWIERLKALTDLVDVVRIDHFRGFSASWEIPADQPTAIHGRWRDGPGPRLFEALGAALGPLPLIAEDLGVVTDDVTELRRRFELPGMHVLQFGFGSDADNPHLPHRCARNAVIYTGTHDNDTTVGWWRSAGAREKHFASLYLGTDGREINWDLIRAASASVADLAIVPMQDVLGLDGAHRLNCPGEASGCWEWRLSWSQVEPWHFRRLAALAAVHGRCELSRADLAGAS
jgi:4-alpha-glucanotransferase